MNKRQKKVVARRKFRVRKKIFGTAEKPRLSVFRSLTQIYAQLIDDTSGNTMAAASSLSKEIADKLKETEGKIGRSKVVGKLLAEKATEKNINTCVFDKNHYRFHGRVKALADGARDGGLKF